MMATSKSIIAKIDDLFALVDADKYLTKQNREMIVENWYRESLLKNDSIKDITQIIIKFSNEYDIFDRTISCNFAKINASDNITEFPDNYELENDDTASAYGELTARPGRKYQWRLKLLSDGDANIGIIRAHDTNRRYSQYWWERRYGYSYFTDGTISTKDYVKSNYGPYLKTDDIIEICLDLKEKYSLSYIVNGLDYGQAFTVEHPINYKLAVSLYNNQQGKIQLISFIVSE